MRDGSTIVTVKKGVGHKTKSAGTAACETRTCCSSLSCVRLSAVDQSSVIVLFWAAGARSPTCAHGKCAGTDPTAGWGSLIDNLRRDRRSAFHFGLCAFPSACLQDGCGCRRQRRRWVRVDVVHGLQTTDLGWSAWAVVLQRTCVHKECAGSDHAGGLGPAIYHLRRDRRFSLSSTLSPLPLCKMNGDVADKGDAGWEFTLSADCGPRTLGPGYDDGLRQSQL